jgi:hypothetical protein
LHFDENKKRCEKPLCNVGRNGGVKSWLIEFFGAMHGLYFSFSSPRRFF